MGIEYIDWKRKINNHFNYVEKLASHDVQLRVIRLQDAMDSSWINYLNHEIHAGNVVNWEGVEELIVKRMDQIFPKMKRVMKAVTLTQDDREDLVSFTGRLKIALDSVGYDSWNYEKKKAIDLFQRVTDKKLKDECMRKTQNYVDKLTVQFILDMDQRLRAGSRDAWEHSDKYGYVDKGVSNNKNNKNNNNSNKPAPIVAKATEAAPKQRKDQKEKKKRLDPPCNYCVTKGIPEPKRSSHQEHECKIKTGQWTWRERQPAQAQAPPQATQAPPQAAGRVSQGHDPSIQQEENVSNLQGDSQPTE